VLRYLTPWCSPTDSRAHIPVQLHTHPVRDPFILVSPSITTLFNRRRCSAPTLVYCRDLNCLTLLYMCTYYAPPPPAVRHCLMCSFSAASLLTTCHVCYLPMLLCLSLLRACGRGLYPFSELVCDLLPRRLFHGSPRAHCRRVFESQS